VDSDSRVIPLQSWYVIAPAGRVTGCERVNAECMNYLTAEDEG